MPRWFLEAKHKMLLATNSKDKLLTPHTTVTDHDVRGIYKRVSSFEEYELPRDNFDFTFTYTNCNFICNVFLLLKYFSHDYVNTFMKLFTKFSKQTKA